MNRKDNFANAVLKAAAAGQQYEYDKTKQGRKLNEEPDAFLIELAVHTELPTMKLLSLYQQPQRMSERNITERLEKGMVFLNEMERAIKVLTNQCEFINKRQQRILDDAEYRDSLDASGFSNSNDMLMQYRMMRDNCIKYMNSAKHRIELLLKSMNQAQKEHIIRNKEYIRLWIRRNWQLEIPEDIFTVISEY